MSMGGCCIFVVTAMKYWVYGHHGDGRRWWRKYLTAVFYGLKLCVFIRPYNSYTDREHTWLHGQLIACYRGTNVVHYSIMVIILYVTSHPSPYTITPWSARVSMCTCLRYNDDDVTFFGETLRSGRNRKLYRTTIAPLNRYVRSLFIEPIAMVCMYKNAHTTTLFDQRHYISSIDIGIIIYNHRLFIILRDERYVCFLLAIVKIRTATHNVYYKVKNLLLP